MDAEPAHLLAIDLGLRTGIAVYGEDGKLRSVRSQSFATMAALKRAVPTVLGTAPNLRWLVVEGDRHLAAVWGRLAEKRGARILTVTPETWRTQLMYARERRSGEDAKQSAEAFARRVIDWSGARKPTSLTVDAAEAVMIGLWGVIQVGWLTVPEGWRP